MKRVRFRDSAGNVRGGWWTVEDGEPVVTAAGGPYGRIAFGDESYSPEEVEVLPPCEPTKVVCVGLNYADHAEETGKGDPDRPMLFLKPPNTVASHNSTVTLLRTRSASISRRNSASSSANSARTFREGRRGRHRGLHLR